MLLALIFLSFVLIDCAAPSAGGFGGIFLALVFVVLALGRLGGALVSRADAHAGDAAGDGVKTDGKQAPVEPCLGCTCDMEGPAPGAAPGAAARPKAPSAVDERRLLLKKHLGQLPGDVRARLLKK